MQKEDFWILMCMHTIYYINQLVQLHVRQGVHFPVFGLNCNIILINTHEFVNMLFIINVINHVFLRSFFERVPIAIDNYMLENYVLAYNI